MDELQALEHLRQTRLKDIDGVAKITKISRHTLIKIKYGTTKEPRWKLMKKLMAWAETRRA
jgi:DNA-binding XRE family transcriptional regulator